LENDLTVQSFITDFEDAERITYDARQKSEQCRDYFDDKQLTEAEVAALQKRGQPPVIFNEIKPKVKTMLGLEKQTRKDPKAFPRNPDDEAAARACTDAIRFVCDDSRWDDVRSAAAKNLAIEGTGAVFVGFKEVRSSRAQMMGGTSMSPVVQLDPEIRKLAWDRFYYDPYSSEDDFADAQFKGVVVWLDLDEARKLYPDADDVILDTWKSSSAGETYDDKPKYKTWADHKRRRVRLCEHYYRDGDAWMYCVFTGAGFVIDPMTSPYLGEDGQPECPIKAISLYVDRDNNRYGEVQSMISPQDEINKRRSKALHTSNTRQLRVSPAVNMSPDKVRKELARPDGVFVGEQGDVEVLGTADMLMGNLNLMQDARDHIHRIGANSAMAGKDTGGQSGKAIALQQMGGMTEAADFLDAIRRLSLEVYRSVWARVRQAWTNERWIRVTDDERNVRFVGLNKPVTALQAIAKQMGVDAENAAEAPPEVQQQLQMLAQDPRAQMIVAIENNVTELDVDIIVDEGMDTPTIQAEQFGQLSQIFPAAPDNIKPKLFELLVRNSAFREKDEVLEQMNAPPDPMQQQMAAMMAQMQVMLGQLEIKAKEADIRKTESETVENIVQAEAIGARSQVDAFKAGASVG
jgi:hypothetical protein